MNTNIALFSSPVAALNIQYFRNATAYMDADRLVSSLRQMGTLALLGLAEICIRNPQRTEGLGVGFSRRDRTLGFALVEKFLSGYDLLSSDDYVKACELAYRYRKQILSFVPSCPEVTIEETETEIVL
jgi:hypothetical protein